MVSMIDTKVNMGSHVAEPIEKPYFINHLPCGRHGVASWDPSCHEINRKGEINLDSGTGEVRTFPAKQTCQNLI